MQKIVLVIAQLLMAHLLMAQWGLASAEDAKAKGSDRSGVTDVVLLDTSDLNESSGLAISNRDPNYFWSHNDSGGDARLYAFDRGGRRSGDVTFESAKMDDWEDMSAYLHDGVPRLLVADCGDNDAKRSQIKLYLFDEPDPTKKTTLSEHELQMLRVTYPDGPKDCEAVAVDVARGMILLMAKAKLPWCGVYAIPLPPRGQQTLEEPIAARRVATIGIPMVTGMDFDPVNGDLWVVSYFHSVCYRCAEREMLLQRQLLGTPSIYLLPAWKQIEAVAVDRSHNVWITSEGIAPPLGRLSPQALADQARQLQAAE